jgi:hypothetical protein
VVTTRSTHTSPEGCACSTVLNGIPPPTSYSDRSEQFPATLGLAPFHAVIAKSRFLGKSGHSRSEHKWQFRFNRLRAFRGVDMDLQWPAT